MPSCSTSAFGLAASLVALLLLTCQSSHARLVQESPLILSYHDGPLLTSGSDVFVNIIWYGKFTEEQKSPVRDVVASLEMEASTDSPSVRNWWDVVKKYTNSKGVPSTPCLRLGSERSDATYSIGKSLTSGDIESLVLSSLDDLESASSSAREVYLMLTADDVSVEGFCRHTCGKHSVVSASDATGGRQILYAWVGNSASQCPGRCAWPFAKAEYGPDTPPLTPPNGDAGVDGMIINVAAILAGTVTNPYGSGFFQGDSAAPLEAATACAGIYGVGALPGYPGRLAEDAISGASFNSIGVNGRRFLLPALWDPSTLSCVVPALSSTINLFAASE